VTEVVEVDLAVVGYGGAGVAAALTAHDLGSSVVVLEKLPADRHTPNTRMSGAMIMTVADPESGARYLDRCAGGLVPFEASAAWANRAAELEHWLETVVGDVDLAVAYGCEHPEFDGSEAVRVVQLGGVSERLDPATGGGPKLWQVLDAAVRRRDIDVRFDTPAQRLIQDESGRVVGVRCQGLEVRARRGVVLACGGYEFDPDRREFLKGWPVHFYGNPGNTGDGVRMAQQVGASLWHMNQMIGRAIGHFELDGEELNFLVTLDPPGYVLTDRFGQRFADEEEQALLRHDFYYHLLTYDASTDSTPRNPCFWFFDERRRRAGPLTLTHIGAPAVGLYDWSPDNSTEIDRGWISKGDTISEAAAGAGVEDPAAVALTVARYNEACATGTGDELLRRAETLVPLDQPPYYCVPLYAGGSNTTGGPRRDERSQIHDVFGDPIAGLYAAGELGQPSGLLYPCDGSNISEALCFGQIAAESALGR
jgi:succinate dehydrogenase/fumarate reductase flavoprotein subunit